MQSDIQHELVLFGCKLSAATTFAFIFAKHIALRDLMTMLRFSRCAPKKCAPKKRNAKWDVGVAHDQNVYVGLSASAIDLCRWNHPVLPLRRSSDFRLIVQSHVQQRVADFQFSVVFDIAQFAKFIHEKAHAMPANGAV